MDDCGLVGCLGVRYAILSGALEVRLKVTLLNVLICVRVKLEL